jgi:hypothetical protein
VTATVSGEGGAWFDGVLTLRPYPSAASPVAWTPSPAP